LPSGFEEAVVPTHNRRPHRRRTRRIVELIYAAAIAASAVAELIHAIKH